eukprot:SAG11_NODE_16211_length_554_cov_1.237363_1_plen_70_part_10
MRSDLPLGIRSKFSTWVLNLDSISHGRDLTAFSDIDTGCSKFSIRILFYFILDLTRVDGLPGYFIFRKKR